MGCRKKPHKNNDENLSAFRPRLQIISGLDWQQNIKSALMRLSGLHIKMVIKYKY